MGPAVETDFCGDDVLGYVRNRTHFRSGRGLELDELYRLAHLPLLAPDHPDVITSRPDKSYSMGRHPPVFSLVMPLSPTALSESLAYRSLEAEIRASSFSGKIAWDLLKRRRMKLHATICSSLAVEKPPILEETVRHELRHLGPIRIQLRGLFSGNINIGRLYLKVHPECRDGQNMLHRVQRAMNRPETDIYPIGVFNLTEHLLTSEAADLCLLLDRWWDRSIAELTVDELWLLGATDDLVLDSRIAEVVPLTMASSRFPGDPTDAPGQKE